MAQNFSWQSIKEAIKETWDSLPDEQKQVLKDRFKEKFGKISDSELNRTGGDREELLNLIQKRYGYDRDRAEKELARWENEMSKEK